MTRTPKLLLAISLGSLLISITGVLWGLFLPVAAIFFGLFMIFNLLAKEMALFDQEQHLRIALAERSKVPASKAVRNDAHAPGRESNLNAAHLHNAS